MRKRWFKTVLMGMALTLSLGMAATTTAAAGNDHTRTHQACITPSMAKLKGDMRRLWIDHILWTGSYITSSIAGLEDQEAVLARLLKNQQDIGNAIKPYYGDAAGNKLAELLTEHIVIAGKLLAAVKSGNQADAEKYNKDWFRNADDIAKFLSDANPNWMNQQLKDLLYTHLQLLTENITARLKKDWPAVVASFDKGEDHIIMLADTLSEGIIKQFPDKFK